MLADRFKGLREGGSPYWHEASAAWLVTSYDDVTQLLGDPRLRSQSLGGLVNALPGLTSAEQDQLSAFYAQWLSLSDGPEHLERRGMLAPILTASRVTPWTPVVQRLARGYASLADPTRIEYTFARPYAAAAIGSVLGLDAAQTATALRRTGQLVRIMAAQGGTREEAVAAYDALCEMSALAQAAASQNRLTGPVPLLCGAAIPTDALAAIFVQVVAGGYDPLAQCITSYAASACKQRGTKVSTTPQDESTNRYQDSSRNVDEVIRVHGPFELLPRITTECVQVSGRPIEAGSRVLLAIGSANQDTTRGGSHVAFGGGRHRCPASSLARLVVSCAMEALDPV